MNIEDITHQMEGICPDDIVWHETKASKHTDAVHTASQPCGCRVRIHDWGRSRRGRMSKGSGRFSVGLEDCCFAPEGDGGYSLPDINWFWGSEYPNCNELHQAQELARLLLAVWKRELVEEYLSDVATLKADTKAIREHYKQTMAKIANKTSAKWAAKFSPVFAGRLDKDIHLSVNHHNPTTLDNEMAWEMRKNYQDKWTHKIKSQVLRMMDIEFDSRDELWQDRRRLEGRAAARHRGRRADHRLRLRRDTDGVRADCRTADIEIADGVFGEYLA